MVEELKPPEILGHTLFEGKMLTILKGQYSNGRLAIMLETEGNRPFAVLSVNLVDRRCPKNHFFVKTWAENETIAKYMIMTGLFEDTGLTIPTGHVRASLWRLKPEYR